MIRSLYAEESHDQRFSIGSRHPSAVFTMR